MMHQGRLPMLLLTFFLCISPWSVSGTKFYSHLGAQCAEDCRLHDSYYQCKVHMADGTEKLQYCSPKMGTDYLGDNCHECCEKQGYGYYWCRTNKNWGYCGEVVEPSRHYTSNYDAQCNDGCQQRTNDYYWCHTQKGYDYCSPRENFDYKGNICHKDYPCDKYGYSYYWCYLEKGGWDYCGRLEPKGVIHQTYKLRECIDDCQYYASGGYFRCHDTGGTWDYCSPLADFTYKNEPCKKKCGKNGESYSWCYTEDSWDYCGIVSLGDCSLTSRRKRRQLDDPNRVCTVVQNNLNFIFTILPDNNAITSLNRNQRTEALDLINQWEDPRLSNQARSNLITSDNFRIDLQGLINRENQQFYNLQIQRNIPRNNRRSTTVAQIIVPIDTPAGIMRNAFRLSLERQARIEIRITPVNSYCKRPR